MCSQPCALLSAPGILNLLVEGDCSYFRFTSFSVAPSTKAVMFSHESSGFHTNDVFGTNLPTIDSFINHGESSQYFSNSKITLNVAARHINCMYALYEKVGRNYHTGVTRMNAMNSSLCFDLTCF